MVKPLLWSIFDEVLPYGQDDCATPRLQRGVFGDGFVTHLQIIMHCKCETTDPSLQTRGRCATPQISPQWAIKSKIQCLSVKSVVKTNLHHIGKMLLFLTLLNTTHELDKNPDWPFGIIQFLYAFRIQQPGIEC